MGNAVQALAVHIAIAGYPTVPEHFLSQSIEIYIKAIETSYGNISHYSHIFRGSENKISLWFRSTISRKSPVIQEFLV